MNTSMLCTQQQPQHQ
jgi:hypothetical protein